MQRIYRAGMALQLAAFDGLRPSDTELIRQAIDELDAALREIRSAALADAGAARHEPRPR